MEYLKFKINNMSISRDNTDKTILISGSSNYYGLEVDLGEKFPSIPGAKVVEFYKNKHSERRDLVGGKCEIPNIYLQDKTNIEFRILSGNTVATPWTSVGITESGMIVPETPEEEPPETMEYVKTYTGDQAAPLLRAGTNGLEYSQDGENWNSGVSGVPEVPATPKGAAYMRTNGDWISAEDYLSENGGEANVINEVKVDGVALPVTEKSVDINLSAYAKTEDIESEYATKTEVADLQVLKGEASKLEELDYSADTTAVISKINEIILAMQTRGIVTT